MLVFSVGGAAAVSLGFYDVVGITVDGIIFDIVAVIAAIL